ncbi:plastocyanin [Acidovorax radicis]|uniref:cupredoxin domain-containing protein n=1 Tax=Acidovorax radicis TaxID=758826 RepID=UPI001CFB486A|nr:plastocyanin [Acidovorax radicis]UCV00467.1 plastocyanin [Acidovorax radicis]
MLDRDGKPVPDAVVVVYPGAAAGAPPGLLQSNPTIEQEKMRFVPAVTVVLPGSTVRFTNQDRWDHHVRGAPAGLPPNPASAVDPNNGFELRLSGKADGKPANFADVKLDTAGVVLLSCHLHGSMRGHVFVTDSAWTLKTDSDGIARFAGVPDGAAQVRVWHAEQLVDLPRKALNVVPGPVLDTVQLSVVPRVRRGPAAPSANTSGGPMGGYGQGPGVGAEQVAHRH